MAIQGLLIHGRSEAPAALLAETCGVPLLELAAALRRVCGVTGNGKPKYFDARLRAGRVTFTPLIKRTLRPDHYVQLSVAVLAAAKTMAHARAYSMAAKAASGDHSRKGNIVSAPLAELGLEGCSDPLATWQELIGPNHRRFSDRCLLDPFIREGEAVVMAVPNAFFDGYNHFTAPRPWMHPGYTWMDRFRVLRP